MKMQDILAFFGLVVPHIRFPDESQIDHTFRNHKSAMQGAERVAARIADQQLNDPKRSELRTTAAESTSTVDQLVRDMRRHRAR